jgi:hypothetical protein
LHCFHRKSEWDPHIVFMLLVVTACMHTALCHVVVKTLCVPLTHVPSHLK